jgi:hypothetical protein
VDHQSTSFYLSVKETETKDIDERVAGDDLLSRWTHYHRPRVLIGRVRDGNGSFHPGLVTGIAGAPGRTRRRVSFNKCVGYVVVSTSHSQSHEPIHCTFVEWGGWAVRPNVRLLVPVRSGGRPPCTSGLSTRSSAGSLHLTNGALISGGVSRLYAFSVYPIHTWLPGGAASATTGTPEVCPSQSSRTREEAPRGSCARSR